jgi:hypothetical protein
MQGVRVAKSYAGVVEDADGRKVIYTTKKDIAEQCFWLKGKKFSLKAYPPMHAIYNCTAQKSVVCSGRQVGKSTYAANFMAAEAIGEANWWSIAVLPSIMQMRRFSNQRVGEVLDKSPIVKDWFINSSCKRNTMERSLRNGSIMYFGALSQLDSLRGLSANRMLEDEVQDMVSEDLAIVEEALSGQASNRKYILRTGTAKTVGGILEKTFQDSTMCEWIVVCPAGHHNIPDPDNIDVRGFVCKKCRTVLDVASPDNYWMATASNPFEKEWVGFRVPQIILPLHAHDAKNWETIVHKRHNLDKITFMNEVMGHAAGSGIDFLTEDDLRNCCGDYMNYEMYIPRGEVYMARMATIDWGLTARKSFTIVSIWGVTQQGRLKLLHTHRFVENDPFKQLDRIAEMITAYGVQVVGADWGAGFVQGLSLEKMIGRKVWQFMYVSEQSELARWDKDSQLWKINRTQAMTETFLKMRSKVFEFPRWEFFKHFAKDILCIKMEPLDDRNMNEKFKYDHSPDEPDDFAHTCVYANVLLYLLLNHKI